MSEGKIAMVRSQERPASTFNGYLLLFLAIVLLGLAVWAFIGFLNLVDAGEAPGLLAPAWIGALVMFVFILVGFFMIQPNQAVLITLFGEFKGTERTQGLRWIWPWMGRKKLSVRAHNIHSERIKINDTRGNPIDVACTVVWRVNDTAQAVFDVDCRRGRAD
jgi:hypothetical protein